MNFRRPNGKAPDMGFPMAPMIDIVFLLLCFFVSSQIFSQWETEIDITLPTAQSSETPERLPGEIIINLRADGETVVNGKTLGREDLSALLARIVDMFPGQPVLIRADRRTAYEHVIRVLDACRLADIWNISFATNPEESASP